MKNFSPKIILFVFSTWLAFSCQSDAEKIGELTYRIKEDSLLMVELDAENETLQRNLDSADALQNALGLGKLSKDEAIQKAKEIDSLFRIQSEKIEDLNRKLKSKGTKYNILRKTIAKQKRELEEARAENERLTSELDEAQTTITTLRTENQEIRTNLDEKSTQLADRERELGDLNDQIAEAKSALETAKREKTSASETFYSLGKDLRGLADKVSGLTNKKKKTELAQQAYCAFKKAHQLGHRNALFDMNSLSSDKKLGKLIDKNKCD